MEFLDNARTDAAGLDELLDTGIAHTHQRKFGCGKEGIGCNQEQDEEHPEQHKGNHEWVILTFQRTMG